MLAARDRRGAGLGRAPGPAHGPPREAQGPSTRPGTGPPGRTSGAVRGGSDAAVAGALAANGIPLVALTAYRNAERRLARDDSGCGLTWSLLAAIGRVESNHGRFAG